MMECPISCGKYISSIPAHVSKINVYSERTFIVSPSITIAESVVLPSSSGEPPAPTEVMFLSSSAAEQPATTAASAEPVGALMTLQAALLGPCQGHVLITVALGYALIRDHEKNWFVARTVAQQRVERATRRIMIASETVNLEHKYLLSVTRKQPVQTAHKCDFVRCQTNNLKSNISNGIM